MLRLLDNSEHDEFHLPRPVEQCQAGAGKGYLAERGAGPVVRKLAAGTGARDRPNLPRHKAKFTRRTSSGQPDETLYADHGAGATSWVAAGGLGGSQIGPQ